MDFDELKKMWSELTDIPIKDDEDGEEVIDAGFYHWPKGTDRYDIWHWFDKQCPNNLNDDLMFPD
ncbi:MAG: hypothetical protein LBL58_13875 [Tannerellaceae bacterium]|jgi:hypothetical protein|nr:hypothetical protein [Tannerellaceae bacterium]